MWGFLGNDEAAMSLQLHLVHLGAFSQNLTVVKVNVFGREVHFVAVHQVCSFCRAYWLPPLKRAK